VTQKHDSAAGATVMVLIRPESVGLQELVDGADVPDGAFGGKVLMHTFLGSVTRMTLDSDIGQLVADVPSLRALTMPPETRVGVQIDPAGVRLLVK